MKTNQVYIVYAVMKTNERFAIAAYQSLESATRHVKRATTPYDENIMSPAEYLGIASLYIQQMIVEEE